MNFGLICLNLRIIHKTSYPMKKQVIFLIMVLLVVSCGTKSEKGNVVEDCDMSEVKAVDLGLSVLWADCNLNATAISEYGDYYTFNDALTLNVGGWRLPTKEELEELSSECDWQWVAIDGYYGYNVIGSNGNSIFFPAAGFKTDGELFKVGEIGNYWTSSQEDDAKWFLDFNKDGYYINSMTLDDAQSVRLVKAKN